MQKFEKLVLLHVVLGGKPLVIDGFEDVLDPWTFTPEWLMANCGETVEVARNLTAKENLPLTIRHYLKNMGLLTNQYFEKPDNYKDKGRQRIYLKDIDCPQVWHDKLRDHIPSGLFYLNESIGDLGGPGAVDEPSGNAPGGRKKGRGIAPAGDLMSSLPPEMRAQNLMCYIGHEGTYTPAHREMCASLGQNIMVNASGTVGEDGKPEKPGSSIWFMTETSDRHLVSEYWLSVLGHDIEVESHFAQVAAWKKAPFKTYVVEQRPGDFILIPPLAPHQVWNRGTRTMKVAWNRTTVETLELAFKEALPNARMVCRDEQYKNKAIVYYTLSKYSNLIRQAQAQAEASAEQAEALRKSAKVRQVQRDFKRLFELYKGILLSEMFSPDLPKERPDWMPFESYVTCAYCRGNIFNRFLTCKSCVFALGTETEEPYDVCMECYAMGRSCSCTSGLTWVEQWRWDDLKRKYEEWRALYLDIDHGQLTTETPLPLMEERRSLQKKTLAHICQEQLKIRPCIDYRNPTVDEEEEKGDEEIIVNEDGTVRRTAKKRSKAWLANHHSCHTCLKKHAKWKMAKCTSCDLWFCYGSLFRAHDLMPQTIMENPRWQCPHCLRVCNTGACRRDPRQRPYEPKGTLLGHDTKKVADARSIEALVDFSVSNLNWLRDEDSAPMRRRREEAEKARRADPTRDERYVEEGDGEQSLQIDYSPADEDESFLDPALRSGPNGTILSGPSPMLDGARPRNGDVPLSVAEEESGTTAWPDEMNADNNSLYPALDGEAESLQFSGNTTKRGYEDVEDHIKLIQSSKKRKIDKPNSSQAKSDATKQFLKRKEKQQLDQAKRDGRYIQVWGAMKGRKLVVSLKGLPSEKLARFTKQDLEKHRGAQLSLKNDADDSSMLDVAIIQSDVAAPKGQAPNASTGTKRKPNKARIALEDDEDYNIKKGEGASKRRGTKKRYEEIDIDTDEEVISGDEHYTPRQRRRRDDGDELVELPIDWKDGLVNTRPSRRRETRPARSASAQIRPSAPNPKPARASAGNIDVISDNNNDSNKNESSEDEEEEEEEEKEEKEEQQQQQRPQPIAPVGRQSTIREAEKEKEQVETARRHALEEENNRLAKLQAARWAEGSDKEENDVGRLDATSEADPMSPPKRVSIALTETNANPAAAPPSKADSPAAAARPSILSRLPSRGKKVKIVSAASKRQALAAAAAASSSLATPDAPRHPVVASPEKELASIVKKTPITQGLMPVKKPPNEGYRDSAGQGWIEWSRKGQGKG
ncbi:Transcription factor jumonji/aspartyl beta-hydroxylase [Macrophomina phaseolina MS6]|uniref:Transcription factor jumonji/aspartyl beta-hydroxylase n=1 Tax=Macrophomina phaseolina (strain MS6) TaxID=1126212 RepID=K2S8V8_MACPH|nr:Transcription factor jumonji/aspartyl beta-hydroxylase [Macrophomina phaseolina MS6]